MTDVTSKRLSKAAVLAALDARATAIAEQEKFDCNNGTSQLNPKERMVDEDVQRAVEYGRMRAIEKFAYAIKEEFRFEAMGASQ